jgi:hypothetical protein
MRSDGDLPPSLAPDVPAGHSPQAGCDLLSSPRIAEAARRARLPSDTLGNQFDTSFRQKTAAGG